jgi:hypothetical protein
MKANKFSNIAAAAQKTTAATADKKSNTNEANNSPKTNIMPGVKAQTSQTAADKPEVTTLPKTGRPAGKRSNAGFKQVTAYIDIETYRKTKIRLFEEDNKEEFSQLVDKLLKNWLKQ